MVCEFGGRDAVCSIVLICKMGTALNVLHGGQSLYWKSSVSVGFKPWLYVWLMGVLNASVLGHVHEQLCPPGCRNRGDEPLHRSLDQKPCFAARGPHFPFVGESQRLSMVWTWRGRGTQPHGGGSRKDSRQRHTGKHGNC